MRLVGTHVHNCFFIVSGNTAVMQMYGEKGCYNYKSAVMVTVMIHELGFVIF